MPISLSVEARPLVTVLVPNYNHARFLPQRLQSIDDQTYRRMEIVLLDDCSTDNSREILEAYSRRTDCRTIFNEKNSGSPFIQWQKGAALARGEYLWIAESDDYADPEFLERVVAVLERSPRVGLAYCQSNRVDENGVVLGSCEDYGRELHPTRWSKDFQNDGRDEVARYLVIQNMIPNASGTVVRRDLFQTAVQGAETRRLSGDWWTWVRMAASSEIAFVAETLNYFRTHNRSVRSTTSPRVECAEELALKAYICQIVRVPMLVRARAFRKAFPNWRKTIYKENGLMDRDWLKRTRRDAMQLFPLGRLKMAACVARYRLHRFTERYGR
jgi:glycosyltransferase involved in cell wall biosynthesis